MSTTDPFCEQKPSVLDFYGLREQPFGVTADGRFLYPSTVHTEALGRLLDGVHNDLGFGALIAEPGLGKTTLLIHLLDTFRDTALTAFVFQTQCSPAGLLRCLLKEWNICTAERDPAVLRDILQDVLVEAAQAGRRVLVIVDEAQNLSNTVLESLRLLSNFESRNGKLLHIVFSGQPRFAERLSRPEMSQLRQRIWTTGVLRPLPADEVGRYVEHRLRIAGHSGELPFSDGAIESIAVRSRGIPREINRLCFCTLSLGYALREPRITRDIAEEAAPAFGARTAEIQPVAERTGDERNHRARAASGNLV